MVFEKRGQLQEIKQAEERACASRDRAWNASDAGSQRRGAAEILSLKKIKTALRKGFRGWVLYMERRNSSKQKKTRCVSFVNTTNITLYYILASSLSL